MDYPKIISEAQCEAYKARRQSIANWGTVYIKLYAAEINELNLRIIEWNCRFDDHNPVQIAALPTKAKKSNLNELPKIHLQKSKS